MNVSIVIPTFNSADTIQINLNSIKIQSFKEFQIIVVDNNSTDNTIEIIIKENLGIEEWEASGLIEYVEHDTLDTLDEEEIDYEISDCGEFDFDEIEQDMKGIGMTFSDEIELNIENGKIMIEGNEISELGEIIGYISSEDKEFILLK